MSPARPTKGEPREAGRALDAEIAEKVMGWRLAPTPNASRHWPLRGTRVWLRPYSPLPVALPHYSTDIAAAWAVVVKLSAKFHARISTPFVLGDLYYAGFTSLGVTGWNGRPDFQEGATTPALAICLAALAAVQP